jgi:hypothetical protein
MRARVTLLLMVSTVLVSCGMVPSSFAACSQPPTTTKLESWPPNLLVGIIVNNVPGGPVSTAYTNLNKAMATPVAVCSPTFVLGSEEPGTIHVSLNMGLFIEFIIEYFFRVGLRTINLLRSRRWPLKKGTVLSAVSTDYRKMGCPVVTVDYEHIVNGMKYSDCYDKPILVHGSSNWCRI